MSDLERELFKKIDSLQKDNDELHAQVKHLTDLVGSLGILNIPGAPYDFDKFNDSDIQPYKCSVCEIDCSGIMGYSCSNQKCPHTVKISF